MADEKRREKRNSSLTVVVFEHAGMCFEGRISDLSEGGFYIDTINPLPEGTILFFRFSLPGSDSERAIVGEARVAWNRPFQGMGVCFTRLSDGDRDQLKQYLNRR